MTGRGPSRRNSGENVRMLPVAEPASTSVDRLIELLPDLLEKGDTFALILSALLTIVPVALVVLAVLAAAGYFFIVR